MTEKFKNLGNTLRPLAQRINELLKGPDKKILAVDVATINKNKVGIWAKWDESIGRDRVEQLDKWTQEKFNIMSRLTPEEIVEFKRLTDQLEFYDQIVELDNLKRAHLALQEERLKELRKHLKSTDFKGESGDEFIEQHLLRDKHRAQETFIKENSITSSPEHDTRYREPKGKHNATEEQIDAAIAESEIYQQAKKEVLEAQRGQIGYGVDKYPNPLNADTWTIIESLNHVIDESVDKLHYLIMVRIKLQRMEESERPKEHGEDEGTVTKPKLQSINDVSKSIGLEKLVESNFTDEIKIECVDEKLKEPLYRLVHNNVMFEGPRDDMRSIKNQLNNSPDGVLLVSDRVKTTALPTPGPGKHRVKLVIDGVEWDEDMIRRHISLNYIKAE